MPAQLKKRPLRNNTDHLGRLPSSFQVPSWLGKGAQGLSGEYDLLPESRAYSFEDVYTEESGESSLVSKRDLNQPIIAEAIQLETAKKQADSVSTLLITAQTREQFDHGSQVVTAAQRNVSRHRINLLKTMMERPPDIELCQDTTERTEAGRRLCVTYTRFESKNDELLHQTQSAYSWTLPGKTADVWDEIVHSDDEVGNSTRLHTLLHWTSASCPSTTWTAGLRGMLHDHKDASTDTPVFVHQFTHGVLAANWQKSEASSKPFKAYTATNGNIRLVGMASVVNINVCDHKQSAFIRSLVKKTIMNTGARIANDNDMFHSNLYRVSIKMITANETHILTYMPFAGPEECTVCHLQLEQPIPQPIRPDETMGILQIPEDDIHNIRSLDDGMVTEMETYTCIGAYRQVRFNEQELNYIHLQGMMENELKPEFFTDEPLEINYDIPIPPAKSARISGAGWDVLVTSWVDTVKNAVATTITAINYPPYGTQVEHANRPKKDQKDTTLPTDVRDKQREDKWRHDLRRKNFYLRGVFGSFFDKEKYMEIVNPNDDKSWEEGYQEKLITIKDDLSRIYTSVWDSSKTFYGNLEANTQKPQNVTETAGEYWKREWKAYMKSDIEGRYRPDNGGGFDLPFGVYLKIADGSVTEWMTLFSDDVSQAWIRSLPEGARARTQGNQSALAPNTRRADSKSPLTTCYDF